METVMIMLILAGVMYALRPRPEKVPIRERRRETFSIRK